MPHLILDYSANMEERTDIAALCDCIRLAAIETGVFPKAGIRVRALKADHVSIADGNLENGYIDISVRLREGRDQETREKATQHIFAAAETFLKSAMNTYPIALSMEMRNIDTSLSPKSNSIRNFMKED
ncbi:MAG: 5-carboxymethyl-2-hydroxymuconate isomerase [Rhizobiaceae bacterium]|nr:5-carboxymethyl-2-hydroxymuconate isomerase [Rhizobiaceae bacterium]